MGEQKFAMKPVAEACEEALATGFMANFCSPIWCPLELALNPRQVYVFGTLRLGN